MAKRELLVEAQSSAPIGTVFKLLATTPTWSNWTPFSSVERVADSTMNPKSEDFDAVGSVKELTFMGLKSREKLISLTEPNEFVYTYLSGGFAKLLKNHRGVVSLSSQENGTYIKWEGFFEDRFAGSGLIVKALVTPFIKKCANGLARYAEKI
ncbi:MAG: SRPBCC family protein [Acidimicrobiales bacterium]|nr:SRPBCC family protein [Acidimicrobiales bacterium]